jgi:hypothetical protein
MCTRLSSFHRLHRLRRRVQLPGEKLVPHLDSVPTVYRDIQLKTGLGVVGILLRPLSAGGTWIGE